MSSCREVTRKLASDELLDQGLGARISVWFHLLLCRHCRRYAEQLRELGNAAKKLWRDDAEETTGELENRIVDDLFKKKDR